MTSSFGGGGGFQVTLSKEGSPELTVSEDTPSAEREGGEGGAMGCGVGGGEEQRKKGGVNGCANLLLP